MWIYFALHVLAQLWHVDSLPSERPERAETVHAEIWSGLDGSYISPEVFFDRAATAEFVIVGEQRCNAEHHAIELRLLRALVMRGRRPALALQNFDADQQTAIDAFARARSSVAVDIANTPTWSGLPYWHEYEPLFELALAENMPIIAGNLPHGEQSALLRGDDGNLNDLLRTLGQLPPLAEPSRMALLTLLGKAQRDLQFPREWVEPLIMLQRVTDLAMARTLMEAGPTGAVLIADNIHARLDFGVPAYLTSDLPLVTVALWEDRGPRPRDLPYDYVWFTPPGDCPLIL